ncbi:ABC transporter ATP-binding protein [Paenibacillus brasilensis]|uniref:Subfamily B ATP-binding cassette protein MsbA n=1 Tax=Paenibacillus brasilensis TaxID=128574 RepID=A0ABU0KX17_9BACL|nr:ABC transporter ATP-binding protein [Paenibacillus brasilensis]MDQ0493829.1 subfamily B ATP-binding cassette protein MsbA [Paenibacillus brasilensis]
MKESIVYKRLAATFRPHLKTVAIILACLIVSAGLNILLPLTSKIIVDQGLLKGDMQAVILYTSAAFLIVCLDKLLNVCKENFRAGLSAQVTFSLFEKAYLHLTRIRMSYFNRTNEAELLNQISTDVGNVSRITDSGIFFIIMQAFSMIGGLCGLLLINWKMTVIVLCFLPIKYVVVKYFVKRRKRLVGDLIEGSSDFAQWFGESIGGMKEQRMFGLIPHRHQQFSSRQRRIVDSERKLSLLDAWNIASESILVQLLMMLLYVVGANLIFRLQLSVGGIFAFVSYSAYVTTPVFAILNIGYILAEVVPSSIRYYQFLDWAEEETSNSVTPASVLSDPPLENHIAFHNVSFSYAKDEPVLSRLNFRIARGEKVAIIGANGAGKSTLLDLMMRFTQPDQGMITYDGIDIQSYEIDAYRSQIALVSQQVYLFDTTILDNICLGAEVSEDTMKAIIAEVGLEELVHSLAYDFHIGSNGSRLSGGQRQKIAMARALVREAPLFIFDEVTSNLDTAARLNVQQLLKTRLRDKTVMIVTHRSEVLAHVDKVILLEKGEPAQIGSHSYFMNGHAGYREWVFEHEEAAIK